MSARALAVILSLLCASQSAFAQGLNAGRPAPHENFWSVRPGRAIETGETLDEGVARLAVKAAFSPSPPPSQQELLDILLFISLRNSRAHGA
jgi:hypothetical protein